MKCVKFSTEHIQICLREQTLSYRGERFPISSSKFGEGDEEGSNKTPLGKFMISEMYGEGTPPYTIFRSRLEAGIWKPGADDSDEDKILSRILRLSGLSKDNQSTFRRYIYIHGTNDEGRIGQKSSIGCIRMKNSDVIALYNQVSVGTLVQIKG